MIWPRVNEKYQETQALHDIVEQGLNFFGAQ